MGVYTDNLLEEVRLERMRPSQVEAAKARRPAIYVPFGSIEWHGYHNALGLDAVKTHEQLIGLAVKAGGVVYPPVFFGSGGGHLEWPDTFMVSKEPMVQIVTELLHGFAHDGYTQAILISGHYPNRPEYLDAAIAAFHASGGKMRVLALIENQAPGVGGDHAAQFETSSMLYLHPELVDHTITQPGADTDDAIHNWMGPEFRGHPCYGLVGVDPRGHASAELGELNTTRLIAYLEQWLNT
jgi:creatinine amidohydrolase